MVYRIKSFLSFPDESVNVLDPCCGEGAALRNLVEGARATTYGLELDQHRAKQAKKDALHHVVCCGYEDARISNSAFSCLFLNPPYDWQKTGPSEEHAHERTEKAFLRGTVRYLTPDGLLVYIVPQPRVTEDLAKILSYRFQDFNTYRFPDEEYERFKQVVLFGTKKNSNYLDDNSLGMLNAIPYTELQEIPHLEQPVYTLPASPEVKLFRSTLIDQAELEKELKSSVLWEKLNQHNQSNRNGVGRPPLPLHTGEESRMSTVRRDNSGRSVSTPNRPASC